MIYLDSAATTLQKPAEVSAAAAWAIRELSSPGRGGHRAAMRAAETAFRTRTQLCRLFNVPEPEQIVFTLNATHALNIAIKSFKPEGRRVVISGYEHNSVYRPLYTAKANINIVSSPLFDREAAIAEFDKALKRDVELAVINHTSNVFGFIQPIEEISRICTERGIPLIIDASQSAGVVDIDAEKLGAAFIAMPGHKGLYGPQGTGVLICNHESIPLLEGGSGSSSRQPEMPDYLPDRLEAGTHNMPGIAGLSEGIRFVMQSGTGNILRHEQNMKELCAEELSGIHGVRLYYTENRAAQSGVLSFNVEGMDCENVAAILSDKGIAVRAGQHCAPLAHNTVGTGQGGTVRVSFSAFNKSRDVRRLAEVVRSIRS